MDLIFISISIIDYLALSRMKTQKETKEKKKRFVKNNL